MARALHPSPAAPGAGAQPAIADLSIEQLIRRRVSLMLERLGDAPIADLYDLVMQEVERGLLGLMLERCHGNRGRAATQLGLHRNTLRQKLALLDLDDPERPLPVRRSKPARAARRR